MNTVQLIEVAPRDGLQNEARFVDTAAKIGLVDALSRTGLREIEVSAFVSPRWLPQLADAEEVFANITRVPGVVYSAVVPNRRGLERAIAANVGKVAVLVAASEVFNHKNLNADIANTLAVCAQVVAESPVPVRGYVSTAIHCPFTGPVAPESVVEVVDRLLTLGCGEISLGETVGHAVPDELARLLDLVVPRFGAERFALHMHDLAGHAVACCQLGYAYGLRRFDCAVTARAGCPYAPGAGGNVSTLALAHAFNVPLATSHLMAALQGLDLEVA